MQLVLGFSLLTLFGSLMIFLYLFFFQTPREGEPLTSLRGLLVLLALLLFLVKDGGVKKDVKKGRIL